MLLCSLSCLGALGLAATGYRTQAQPTLVFCGLSSCLTEVRAPTASRNRERLAIHEETCSVMSVRQQAYPGVRGPGHSPPGLSRDAGHISNLLSRLFRLQNRDAGVVPLTAAVRMAGVPGRRAWNSKRWGSPVMSESPHGGAPRGGETVRREGTVVERLRLQQEFPQAHLRGFGLWLNHSWSQFRLGHAAEAHVWACSWNMLLGERAHTVPQRLPERGRVRAGGRADKAGLEPASATRLPGCRPPWSGRGFWGEIQPQVCPVSG